eukprot:sb/3466729/
MFLITPNYRRDSVLRSGVGRGGSDQSALSPVFILRIKMGSDVSSQIWTVQLISTVHSFISTAIHLSFSTSAMLSTREFQRDYTFQDLTVSVLDVSLMDPSDLSAVCRQYAQIGSALPDITLSCLRIAMGGYFSDSGAHSSVGYCPVSNVRPESVPGLSGGAGPICAHFLGTKRVRHRQTVPDVAVANFLTAVLARRGSGRCSDRPGGIIALRNCRRLESGGKGSWFSFTSLPTTFPKHETSPFVSENMPRVRFLHVALCRETRFCLLDVLPSEKVHVKLMISALCAVWRRRPDLSALSNGVWRRHTAYVNDYHPQAINGPTPSFP